jgi:S1-C subfamily serine protease
VGRLASALLLALALGSGGGFGAVAATRLLPQQSGQAPALAQPASSSLQPTQLVNPAAVANVAGEVFKKVNPSVVQVVVAGRTTGGRMGSGAGSGFVVDANGHIVTNNHVVEGGRAISVRFSSGESREAQVVGTDRGNDLALLKVDLPAGVPVAQLGDSDHVEIGELAIAIGSPFGLDQSVTQGIISAVSRTWAPGDGRARRGLLQTDAPINPGNSGGPLLNAAGEVIGVTSMIESPVRANVGVGFAIPVNTAKRLLPQLQTGARLEPVWLGITGQAVDPAIARDQGLRVQDGVLILSVVPDGPAARAGLRGGQSEGGERIPRGGDVIVALDGTPVRDLTQLVGGLSGRRPGEEVTVTIVRGGQRQDVRVTLQAWPAETPSAP